MTGAAASMCSGFDSRHRHLLKMLVMYYLKRKAKKKKDKPLPLFDKAGIKVRRRTDYVKKLDKVFSLYIRLRDAMPGGCFRCVSCGQIKPFAQADAGHYYSRRHMSTRFDEDNVHAECRACNRFKADHLIGYRENLIRRIGQMRFDKLEWKSRQAKHWTDFELKELIRYYSALVEKLEKDKGILI